ncbi:hypothetical protein K474DRAFT_1674370 [Panus rudis PR-1116 ss-1]|nr:hypothetical protein K474DRAFT_1674370 [Panus rudis PR-1116 ss-1]
MASSGSPRQQLRKTARQRDQRRPAKKWGPSRNYSKPCLRPKLTDEDLKKIGEKIKITCGWQTDPRAFQLAGVKSQIEGTDTIIQASTGAGKTAIAAGPHFHASSTGKCTIMVEPLIQLQDEMVVTFREEFKLRAIAVNSKTGTLSRKMVNEILSGQYQIILVSPEMLQSRAFINKILRNTSFAHRVLSIFIDEAHCISHWGANFRKKYGTVGIVRAFLPSNVPVMAVTATLMAKVRRDIQSKLHFPRTGSMFLNVGNDRSNVSLVTRACQYPMSSFADIDFVIPARVASREDIPKTYIYVDNINEGTKMVDHLYDVLRTRNPALADAGIIRPFNAVLSHEYRTKAIGDFRRLCQIGCKELVVLQEGVVERGLRFFSLSRPHTSFIRKMSTATERPEPVRSVPISANKPKFRPNLPVWLLWRGIKGFLTFPRALVGRLAPFSATQVFSAASKKVKKGTKKNQSTKPARPNTKQYAADHGINRGGESRQDALPTGDQPKLNTDREDEGLLAFVQSTRCRRKVWLEVFENGFSAVESLGGVADIPCCDICDPGLLDLTRPGKRKESKIKRAPPKGIPDVAVQERLEEWRKAIFNRDYEGSQLDPTAILDGETIELLSSLGPLKSTANLERLLKRRWVWWHKYGPPGVLLPYATPVRFADDQEGLPVDDGAPRPDSTGGTRSPIVPRERFPTAVEHLLNVSVKDAPRETELHTPARAYNYDTGTIAACYPTPSATPIPNSASLPTYFTFNSESITDPSSTGSMQPSHALLATTPAASGSSRSAEAYYNSSSNFAHPMSTPSRDSAGKGDMMIVGTGRHAGKIVDVYTTMAVGGRVADGGSMLRGPRQGVMSTSTSDQSQLSGTSSKPRPRPRPRKKPSFTLPSIQAPGEGVFRLTEYCHDSSRPPDC